MRHDSTPPSGLLSIRLCEIEEDNHRRITDGRVMVGEVETAGFAIHMEGGDVVATLIAAIEELAAGAEIEAARIVSARPFFTDKCQNAI